MEIDDEALSQNSDHSLTEGDSACEAGKAEFLEETLGKVDIESMAAATHCDSLGSFIEDRIRSIAILWVHKCYKLMTNSKIGTVLSPSQELLRRLSFARCEAELYVKLKNSVDPTELYTLLRYTLFGNVLCLGQPWNLQRIEKLLGYAII